VAIWITAILLIAAVALFIAAPLSDDAFGGRSAVGDAAMERREHQHALALQALRDLEFDYAMGKLDADDYRGLREKLENRALAAMSGQETTRRQPLLDRAAPAGVSQPNAPARAVGNFCTQCGKTTGSARNFCANCGAAFEAEGPSPTHENAKFG